MEVFAQGLIGLPDYFIHPAYVSGAGYEQAVIWGTIYVIVSIILLSVLYQLIKRSGKRKKEKTWNHSEYGKPPP